MATESCSMFDERFLGLMNGIRVIGYKYDDDKDEEVNQVKDKVAGCQDKSGVSCQVCQVVTFDSVKAQRDHFKLDWHRFNVKQRLMGKPSVSEEDFEETISGELSSISGSDTSETESDDDNDLTMEGTAQALPQNPLDNDEGKERRVKHDRSHPKIFLSNDDKCVFSLYRANVYSSKKIPEEEAALLKKISNLTKESLWVILMTAGGHFAAAVFEGDSVVAHKTFHRYTVRAKRGTAQGMRDSQQGIQPKSAGASLRRYNEAALIQDVHDLLEAWSGYLEKCHKIFVRVPTYNKPMFFGGKNPPLDKNDSRIRTIPIATRRPTFKEVQRVHQELARVEILGHENDVLSGVLSQMLPIPKKSQIRPSFSDPQIDNNTTHKITDEKELVELNDSLIADGLCEPVQETIRNTSVSSKKNKKKKSNCRLADGNGKEKMSTITGCPDRDVVLPGHHVWNRLYCAIVSGNMKVITDMLQNSKAQKDNSIRLSERSTEDTGSNGGREQEDKKVDKTEKVTESIQDVELMDGSGSLEGRTVDAREVMNERWGEEGSTLLHVAAKSTQAQIIDILMRNGADPGVKDDGGRTPYDRAKSKESRDEFRRYMADFPDAFDYTKSHIPSPLTQEMKEEKERKEAEKKKAQKKARKQRIKEQKAVEQKKKEEEDKRKKSETISEREKRALAAERRFAKQQLKSSGSSGSCAMCSQDLAGRVPFERLDFKYCSTACVRQHRLILENKDR